MRCNTSESIIMARSTPQPKHAIVLRTILSTGVLASSTASTPVLRTILSTGVLAVLLAGAAVGATWVLDDDGGDVN